MTTPDAKPGFEAFVNQESLWRNEFGVHNARVGVRVRRRQDDTTEIVGEDRARRPAPGELRRYPYGHFEIYHDPKVKSDQLEFLSRVLATSSTSASPAATDH
jgi:uncharacterized protein